MYEDETQWFSVPLLTYKDSTHGTDGYLRISLSTNTKDFRMFNPPSINISISQTYQKSCNLNITSVKDLVEALVEFSKANPETSPQIRRKISAKMELHILRDSSGIIFQLFSNDTDHVQVKMDFYDLSSIFHILKTHVANYYDVCKDLLLKSIDSEVRKSVLQLPNVIKGMPSQILSNNNLDRGAAVPEDVVKETEMTIENLDEFLGGEDMKNIKVAELETKKETPVKVVDSKFVNGFLNNDLRNLETILNNTNNMDEVIDKLRTEARIKPNDENFSLLPGIKDEEYISLLYVSQILVNTIERSYVDFNSPIPSTTPVLKYKVNKFDEENLELAYDLLLFSGYIRNVRRRLEDKIDDARENKSIFHLKFRCFLDPLYFSFIEKVDKNLLESIIVNRFKYYESIGVFDEYKNTLEMNNCPTINEQDIASFVNEVCEKVIGQSLFILEQHDKLMTQNNFKIGSNSNFTKEQIINEIVPLEVAEKLGKDISTIEGISDEIKNFFKEKKKVKVKKSGDPIKKVNHLFRVVNTLKKDIPEKYREEFLEWLENFKDKNFVFDDKYPYAEFGDDIIKALYVWKPEDDPKLAKSLKHYQTQIEKELMEKSYILSLESSNEEESKKEVDFESINWDM